MFKELQLLIPMSLNVNRGVCLIKLAKLYMVMCHLCRDGSINKDDWTKEKDRKHYLCNDMFCVYIDT